MKKIICILLVASLFLSVFAGCSEENPQQPDDTTVTDEIEETAGETTDVFIDYEGRGDLYKATASSGISMPEKRADYFYISYPYIYPFTYRYFYKDVENIPEHRDAFVSDTLNQKVNDFIRSATDELSKISEEEVDTYLKSIGDKYRNYLNNDKYNGTLVIEKKMINGYFSVLVAIPYFNIDTEKLYYYDVRTIVFDIYTEEELEFSDMFFDDVDFVPILNNYIAKKSREYKMKRDFSGLVADNFAFTVDSVIIIKDSDFVNNGITIPLSEYGGNNEPWIEVGSLMEYMVTSVPRDMTGYLKEDLEQYREIVSIKGGIYERKDICDVWYLETGIPFATDEACNKVNVFIDNLYESYFSQEKLNEMANAEINVKENQRAEFHVCVVGERYILFSGNNFIWPEGYNKYYSFLDDFGSMFYYYFDVKTGEELNPDCGTLFTDGWQEAVEYYYQNGFNGADAKTWVEYNKTFDIDKCKIMNISCYASSSNYCDPDSSIENPVYVDVETEDGERVMILVPREFIK